MNSPASGSAVDLRDESKRRHSSRRKSSAKPNRLSVPGPGPGRPSFARKSISAPFGIPEGTNRTYVRKLIDKRANSVSNFDEMNKRGSDYFGTAENSLLFGSSSTQIHHAQDMPLDFQGSADELEARSSYIMFSGTASKESEEESSSTTDPTKSFTTNNKSLLPNVAFPRHNLKARPSDLLYLKKRILYPGIWEEDSEEEPDKATLITRRPPGVGGKTKTLAGSMAAPQFKPTHFNELDEDSEGCTSKSGSGNSGEDASQGGRRFSASMKSDSLSNTSERQGSTDDFERTMRTGQQRTQVECKKPVTSKKSKSKSKKSELAAKSSFLRVSQSAETHTHTHVYKKKEGHKDVKSKAHEDGLSLLEKICILKEESKRPMTLKERFLGHKPIHGFPGCFDKTEGYPECMKPGELVRTQINTQRLWKIPQDTPLSRDQFVSLMRSIETHDRNDYICLIYSLPETHPDFNPYRFKIVSYNQVPPTKAGFYTLSKYGFLHFSHGFAEYTSMVQFQTQMLIYDYIIKIPFFAKFRIWKAFTMWRVKIRGRKMTLFRSSLLEDLFINKRPLQLVLKELIKMCEKMGHMGFLKLKSTMTYGLEEFLGYETAHANEVLDKLKTFEGMVVEMTSAACRATLIEDGFSQDSYAEEMDFYMKYMEQPADEEYKPFVKADYPGQWLTYSQQTKKKHICRRLTDFIRLVDYYVQHTYYQIMKNSMVYLMLEMHKRVQYVPDPYLVPPPYAPVLSELVKEHEKHGGRMILTASTEPLFEINCTWTYDNLVISPSVSDFVKGFRFLFYTWKKTIMSYENMVKRPIFNPYTQPIINGYVDKKTCGEGPNMKLLIQNDSHLLGVADVIQAIILHGFEACDTYIKTLDHIHQLCLENEKTDVNVYKKETDARVFFKLQEKFEEQLESLEHVEDVKGMGVFRVDNNMLKTYVHTSITRCEEALRKNAPEEEEDNSDSIGSLSPDEADEEEEEEEEEEEAPKQWNDEEEGEWNDEGEDEDGEEEEGGHDRTGEEGDHDLNGEVNAEGHIVTKAPAKKSLEEKEMAGEEEVAGGMDEGEVRGDEEEGEMGDEKDLAAVEKGYEGGEDEEEGEEEHEELEGIGEEEEAGNIKSEEEADVKTDEEEEGTHEVSEITEE